VPCFFSSHPNWDHPHTRRRACRPPILVPGGGTHSLAGEGVGVPIRTRGQTLWFSRPYMYFLDLSKVYTVQSGTGGRGEGGWSQKQRERHGCSFISFQSSFYLLRTENTCSIAGPHPVFLTALAFCASHLILIVKCTKLICSYNDTTKNFVFSVVSCHHSSSCSCSALNAAHSYSVYALSCSYCAVSTAHLDLAI
jgi:hypothetical protein